MATADPAGHRDVRARVLDWVGRRQLADRDSHGNYIGRHETQLESTESVLDGAADALVEEAESIQTALDSGALFRRCRRV